MPQNLASLTELSTLEALIDAEGVDGLLAALDDALARTPADTRVLHEDGPTVGPRTLGVLRKAVTLDADFLREHPEAIFQCLYNRLRWYDAPDAARHFSVTGQGPWDDPEAHLHQLAAWWRRQRESSGGAPWVESLLPLRGALEGADVYLWHESQVLCAAFDATGTRLATGSYSDGSRADGNNVHVWDVATGKQLRVMEGHEMEVRGISWSPDGKQLASGSRAHEARVWDVETGEHLHLFRRQEGQVTSVAFSPDGTLLAVANLGWLIHLYDLNTGEKVRTLKGHQQSVLSVAFHPSGRWLVSGASDDTVRVWEVATGEQVARLDAQRSVSTVAFSPDGEWLAWADLDDVGVAETKTWQRVRGIQGGSRYSHVQWLGTSRLGLLGYDRLEVLDVKDGASVWSRHYSSDGHERGAAFSPDLKHFALTAVDGGVLLSQLDAPTPPRLLSEQHRVKHLWGRAEGALAVAMRMDGMLVIDAQGHVREPPPEANASNLHAWRFSGNDALAAYPVTSYLEDGWRRGIQLFDLTRLAPTMELTGKPLEGRDASRKMTMKQVMTFSPDTTLLAGTFELGVVRVWRVADGQLLHTLKGPEAPVTMVEFTPDGAYVVSGHEEPSRLQVHDVKTGRLVLDTQALMKPAVAYTAAARVPRIAVGRASGELELFDLTAGFRRVLQVSEEPVIAARLSEDGLRVAVCTLDDRVRLYEADTGRLMYEVQHPALPFLVAMEGDVLVTRSDDQKTRFFDLATGAPREVLNGNAEPDEVTRRAYWEVLSDEPVAFHRRMDTTPLARFHDSLEETIILRDGLVVARGLTVPDFLYVLKLHDASGGA
ncbi:High-affnity carbon uptake protein Hat/HatR [Corallococcus sp. ZKHCc1 1396]|uniref:High-affnity carbon uptake protein Hat/HatR n=1 Tax=Corallococcus soli TaxID=2710757 RepID=A0ABR9PKT7_9BACT|nr:WD40 repeat domain-containing protein [Corallococcus soli]MBE4748522.1 High-affnity carbon uptake protein Hat/HatR [Corallococcus soli]